MSIPFLNIFLSPGGMRHRKYAACPKGSKKQLPLSEKYVIMHKNLFLRAMSQAAVLARTVGECREGPIPRPLGRCKLDTPLLAAGSLIDGGRKVDDDSDGEADSVFYIDWEKRAWLCAKRHMAVLFVVF